MDLNREGKITFEKATLLTMATIESIEICEALIKIIDSRPKRLCF